VVIIQPERVAINQLDSQQRVAGAGSHRAAGTCGSSDAMAIAC
jgi:hypothetical protein